MCERERALKDFNSFIYEKLLISYESEPNHKIISNVINEDVENIDENDVDDIFDHELDESF